MTDRWRSSHPASVPGLKGTLSPLDLAGRGVGVGACSTCRRPRRPGERREGRQGPDPARNYSFCEAGSQIQSAPGIERCKVLVISPRFPTSHPAGHPVAESLILIRVPQSRDTPSALPINAQRRKPLGMLTGLLGSCSWEGVGCQSQDCSHLTLVPCGPQAPQLQAGHRGLVGGRNAAFSNRRTGRLPEGSVFLFVVSGDWRASPALSRDALRGFPTAPAETGSPEDIHRYRWLQVRSAGVGQPSPLPQSPLVSSHQFPHMLALSQSPRVDKETNPEAFATQHHQP